MRYRARKISWTTLAWLPVLVLVNRSYDIPSPCRSSVIWRVYLSAACCGVRPSFSAWTWIGVPCSSVPDTMSTLLPAIRW